MAVCENDVLVIPEEFKKMSISEIEEEKEKMLQEICSQDRLKKGKKTNKRNIVFNF